MRRSPRAVVMWATALLVALATARFVAADLATLHRSARALGAPRGVVVASHDLPLGALLDPTDLRIVRSASERFPSGTLGDERDAVGRIVTVPVLAGAPVLEGALAPGDRTGLDGLVPEGRRAIRIADDAGLAPAPGAVVDVMVTIDPSLVAAAGGGDPTVIVARAALVLPSAPTAATARPGGGAPSDDSGITLLVTEDEAKRLAFATAHGVVTLALAPPEDACCRTSSSGSSRD